MQLLLRFIKYALPVIIYALLIFYISSIPGQDLPELFPYQDIVLHIIEYAIFTLLISRALKEYYPAMIYIKRFLWVFFLAIIYASSDEFHQAFVPNRYPSFYDIICDGIGIFMANIFYR